MPRLKIAGNSHIRRRPGLDEGFLRGFTSFPNQVFGVEELTKTDIMIYITVCSYCYRRSGDKGRELRCWPSQETIGNRARCDPKTVRAGLRRLEMAGFLFITRRGRGETATITLVYNRETFLRDRAANDAASARQREVALHAEILSYQRKLQKKAMTPGEYNAALRQLEIKNQVHFVQETVN